MKKIIGGLFVTLLFIGAGCQQNTTIETLPANNETSTTTGSTSTTMTNTPTTTGTTTSTTKPTTTTTENTNATKMYTMDEVKSANTPEKCWTVIRGTVYNLTAWIEKHPGGERGILSLCGVDGTEKYTGKHGGQAGPEKALAGFEMGKLK
jgi:cytochrome b involved in lipid metabolism